MPFRVFMKKFTLQKIPGRADKNPAGTILSFSLPVSGIREKAAFF
jgi:hypothetical protein